MTIQSQPPDSPSERSLGPAVAGTWYPGSEKALSQEVDRRLKAKPDGPPGPASTARARLLTALIVPHAGFVYSGDVAAGAFRLVRGNRFGRVLLFGPSHYEAFEGACVPDASAYRTPLGAVPIDTDAISALRNRQGIHVTNRPFEREHCLEAELPFLQRVLGSPWKLVPVLIGAGGGPRAMAAIVAALGDLLDTETLAVVSSDFTHYGPRFGYVPFRERLADRIRELDMGAVDRIVALDRDGFDRYVAETGATICGRRPIDALLGMLPEEVEARLVSYDTSGRQTGDWNHSVSYASLAFHRRS